MSLAGVILALGDMVDSACVLVENAHKKIAEAEREGSEGRPQGARHRLRARARPVDVRRAARAHDRVPAGLRARRARRGASSGPLALSKTFSMAFASIFAVTLVPALMVTLPQGQASRRRRRTRSTASASRPTGPLLRACLRGPIRAHRASSLALARRDARPVLAARLRVHAAALRGGPPLHADHRAGHLGRRGEAAAHVAGPADPRRCPRWSASSARRAAPRRRSIRRRSRCSRRSCSLKPREQWRAGHDRWSGIVAELDERTQLPGVQGAWTMPIKARIDMLSTGIRTPIGVKVFGPDLEVIARDQRRARARAPRRCPDTRSVYAERELGGFFLDVTPDREAIARYGLTVRDVLDVVESSIGGMDVAHDLRRTRALPHQRALPARAARQPRGAAERAGARSRRSSPRPLPVGAASRMAAAAMGAAPSSAEWAAPTDATGERRPMARERAPCAGRHGRWRSAMGTGEHAPRGGAAPSRRSVRAARAARAHRDGDGPADDQERDGLAHRLDLRRHRHRATSAATSTRRRRRSRAR